jgi:hypothetical protein
MWAWVIMAKAAVGLDAYCLWLSARKGLQCRANLLILR